MHASYRTHRAAASAALLGVLAASSANAQTILSEQAEVLAANGDAPVGAAAGIQINGSGALDLPVISEDGTVAFRARYVGAVTSLDDRAYCYKTPTGPLTELIRAGDPAPGLAGLTLNSTTSQGLGSAIRINPSGTEVLFMSRVDGAGVTTDDDSGLFGGPIGSLDNFAREGDPAPNTVGATFSSTLSSLSAQNSAISDVPRILFKSNVDGGDTISGENDQGWFGGDPTSLELIQRRGEVQLDGTVLGSLGFLSQMNAAGTILLSGTLSTTLGSPPASDSDNSAVWYHFPGVGNIIALREGDTVFDVPGATFNDSAFNNWSVGTGSTSFNNLGFFVARLHFEGPGVTPDVDDTGIFLCDNATQQLLIRAGDPAPGTDGVFAGFNTSSLYLNDAGDICFEAFLAEDLGLGIDEFNDSGVWFYRNGITSLIAREAEPAPETGGGTYGNLNGQSIRMNARGQIVFNNQVQFGEKDPSQTAIFFYDPEINNVRPLVIDGDTVDVNGNTEVVSSFGSYQFTNTNANPLGFTGDGDHALRVGYESGVQSIVRVELGSMTGKPDGVSLAAGGTHDMYLDAGPLSGNNLYLVLGTVSGTTPGIPVGAFTLPLTFDGYLNFTLLNANSGVLQNTLGFLDANGRAAAALNVSAGTNPGLAGTNVDHAFIAFDLALIPTFVSEATRVQLLP